MKFLSSRCRLPSIFMTNVRSLRPKIDELALIVSCLKPTVVGLSETWLNDSVSDDEISLRGYDLLRQDRLLSRRGGGVSVYIGCGVVYERVTWLQHSPSFMECLWIYLRSFKIVLCVLYIPPNLKVNDYRDALSYFIESSDAALIHYANSRLIVMGDFNQFPVVSLSQSLDLVPTMDAPTRGNSILDQILIYLTAIYLTLTVKLFRGQALESLIICLFT